MDTFLSYRNIWWHKAIWHVNDYNYAVCYNYFNIVHWLNVSCTWLQNALDKNFWQIAEYKEKNLHLLFFSMDAIGQYF